MKKNVKDITFLKNRQSVSVTGLRNRQSVSVTGLRNRLSVSVTGLRNRQSSLRNNGKHDDIHVTETDLRGKKWGGGTGGRKKRMMRIVATSSLPAVDRPTMAQGKAKAANNPQRFCCTFSKNSMYYEPLVYKSHFYDTFS